MSRASTLQFRVALLVLVQAAAGQRWSGYLGNILLYFPETENTQSSARWLPFKVTTLWKTWSRAVRQWIRMIEQDLAGSRCVGIWVGFIARVLDLRMVTSSSLQRARWTRANCEMRVVVIVAEFPGNGKRRSGIPGNSREFPFPWEFPGIGYKCILINSNISQV